jgi:hypothetical protein
VCSRTSSPGNTNKGFNRKGNVDHGDGGAKPLRQADGLILGAGYAADVISRVTQLGFRMGRHDILVLDDEDTF